MAEAVAAEAAAAGVPGVEYVAASVAILDAGTILQALKRPMIAKRKKIVPMRNILGCFLPLAVLTLL